MPHGLVPSGRMNIPLHTLMLNELANDWDDEPEKICQEHAGPPSFMGEHVGTSHTF